jgi:predicted GIY-YIG superfamily endonuclease
MSYKLKYRGYTVYVILCGDGSYYADMCLDIVKELRKAADGRLPHFNNHPERFPIEVVFLEEGIVDFTEAYFKREYLHSMNKVLREKLVRTKKWPTGKKIRQIILKKMKKYFDDLDAQQLY